MKNIFFLSFVFLLPLFLFLSPKNVLADLNSLNYSKLASYSFDETSQQTLIDSISGFNGSVFQTVSVDGKYNKARRFSSSSDAITLPLVLNEKIGLTISTWVKMTDTPKGVGGLIFYNGDPGQNGFGIWIQGDGTGTCGNPEKKNLVMVLFGGITCNAVNSNYHLPLNEWINLVLTSSNDGNWILYANGEQKATGNQKPNTPLGTSVIGNIAPSDNSFFPGEIDETIVWSRDLSKSEILENFQKTPIIKPVMKEIYLSPSGNDANPGTETQPLQTLIKARDIIRTINQNMTGDIKVYLKNGYYWLNTPFDLTALDSGTNGHKIIYQNYPNEYPLISGGRQITGWIKENNNIYKAFVGINVSARQFYVNGIRQKRARSNGGLAGAIKTATGYTTSDLTLQNYNNKDDMEIVANVLWKQFRCGISDINAGNVTIKQPCFNNSQLHCPTCNLDLPTFLENAYEFLDEPGEWYLNKKTGWIYYYPKTEENLSSAITILPILETLISGIGSLDQPIHDIEFKGIGFSYATWNRPSTNEGYPITQAEYSMTGPNKTTLYDQPLASTWTKNPANINFEYANNIVFENNVFQHLGAVGLNIGNGSKNVKIIGNHFTDISAAALTLGDVNKPQTTNDREITRNNLVLDNYVNGVAAEYQSSVGFWFGYLQNTIIGNNELENLPYSGISIGWGWGANDPTVAKNNKVQNNLIHNTTKTLVDGGSLYSLSSQPGNIYLRNVFKDGLNVGALDYNSGFYLDDNSRYIEGVANVVFNTLAHMSFVKGGDHYLHHNYWQNRFENDMVVWFNNSFGPNIIENNTIINNLSDVPQYLLSGAGLESSFQSIKNLPTYTLTLSCPLKPRGDVNCTGKIDIYDYNIFLGVFGQTGTPGWISSDLRVDGKIDIYDYSILLGNFGAGAH